MSDRPPDPVRRRLIVELCHGAADRDTLHILAGFAASLELDLHGLFIEDEALLGLAELPFARQIRLPTHEWQTLDAGRLTTDLRQAANEAHRMLQEAATALGVPNAFEVLRGDPATVIAGLVSASDIVVIAEPKAASRLEATLAALHAAMHNAAASMLLLPALSAGRQGPVVALLADAGDASLAFAARAAANTRQMLLLLLPSGNPALAEQARQRAVALGVPRVHVTTRAIASMDAESVLHALGHRHAALLVLSRDASPAGEITAASRIAAQRGVPLLLVERPADH